MFSGSGAGLTNLDADNLTDVHNLTWGNGLTSSNGSAYSITSSIHLNVHISGSEITASQGGLYIPGRSIRLDQITSSKAEGSLLSWSGSNKVPYEIPIGTLGQVLTAHGVTGAAITASFQDLPPSTGMGIKTGSVDNDLGNGIGLVLTSSAATNNIVANIPISGSDNQITVSGSLDDNTIHLRLADNITGISSITASAGIRAATLYTSGDISASGNLLIGGDFTVLGTTTLIDTTNLLVEDAFLVLSSGSTSNAVSYTHLTLPTILPV